LFAKENRNYSYNSSIRGIRVEDWKIMPYDSLLAMRIRAALGPLPELQEKKMFGGVGFLLNGNMACGVHKNDLIIRVGPENYAQALCRPYTHVFDMTGHPMAGWVMVAPEGCATESDLQTWVNQGLAFARSLPSKGK
jgi:TfoX/Sxy family transcriptional regulator of competence genes